MKAYLGEFEQLVLLAVLRLGDDAYGVTVHREIERRAGRRVSLGTVYTTLTRLEAKGCVLARIGEPTTERGGRRKKYFVILPLGRSALQHSFAALRKMTRGLDAVWEVR